MREEICRFIENHKLTPFVESPAVPLRHNLFKTKDAKAVHTKVLSLLSKRFTFKDTTRIWSAFHFTDQENEIRRRQKFFSSVKGPVISSFLKELNEPAVTWRPPYSIIVATEDIKVFMQLCEHGVPVTLLQSPQDVVGLDDYDVCQVIKCDEYTQLLEQLPNSVFVNSIEDVYLERFLKDLSGWAENLKILRNNVQILDSLGFSEAINSLSAMLDLLDAQEVTPLSLEVAEKALDEINYKVSKGLKTLTIPGDSLFAMLSQQAYPGEISDIIDRAITESGLQRDIFSRKVPVVLDDEALQKCLQRDATDRFTSFAEKVARRAAEIKKIPVLLRRLQTDLILFDFMAGLSFLLYEDSEFPQIVDGLELRQAKNIFLEKPQPVSFFLDNSTQCSILTGANSGGKTTLIEHILQVISLHQLGLPVRGKTSLSLFSEVYYFAKNKGSMNKGAFETLLMQMSRIKPGHKTLVLADEIESVTEPGVAGDIIAATCAYYVKKGCYLVIATHLGHEIIKKLPNKTRIDGIEAKGLDENFELIIDHNPVLGRLAHSTPELILERLARSKKTEYFNFINIFVKNR